jgi:hypothetical protein
MTRSRVWKSVLRDPSGSTQNLWSHSRHVRV